MQEIGWPTLQSKRVVQPNHTAKKFMSALQQNNVEDSACMQRTELLATPKHLDCVHCKSTIDPDVGGIQGSIHIFRLPACETTGGLKQIELFAVN